MHPHRLLSAVAVLFIASACGSEAPETVDKAPLASPHLARPGKADDPGAHVQPLGTLAFGSAVTGEFIHDAQLDGYVFSAKAGAVVTLDNSNLGTSRNLDSTMFLFGPRQADGSFGGDAIEMDDDSGWGAHARIKGFQIPTGGAYLAVLGTYADEGRGHYRLALSCESGKCVETCSDGCDDGDPSTKDSCDPGVGCVHEPTGAKGGAIDVQAPEKLVTTEARGIDSFSVHIDHAPTQDVIVWVASSDASEAEAQPTKLLFCRPGFHVGGNGCAENTEDDPGPESQWREGYDVTVFGVRDRQSDGDIDYQVSLTVQTDDPSYAKVSLPPISGVNRDVATTVDYSALDGLQDDDLLRALHELLKGNTTYGYMGQNSARTIMFNTVDNIDGQVESIYTGQTIPAPLDAKLAYQAGFNTEHTWPQSQFDKLEPMKSDLHHVFPTDINSNGLRSSYDYGWVSGHGKDSSSVLGVGVGGKVYQVRPEMRGDVARAHFYMVARYKFDTQIGIRFDDDKNEDNGCIRDSEETVLREWDKQDPVSELERERNDRIEAYQGTSNPFVDMPQLADRVSDF